MIRVTLNTEFAGNPPRTLSTTEQVLQDGDTVVARISIGQDDAGQAMVQVEMLVNRAPGEAEPARRSDA